MNKTNQRIKSKLSANQSNFIKLTMIETPHYSKTLSVIHDDGYGNFIFPHDLTALHRAEYFRKGFFI